MNWKEILRGVASLGGAYSGTVRTARRLERKPRSMATLTSIQGLWGEDVACDWYRAKGYEILRRNCRPGGDKRMEVDFIALSADKMELVFCEVKTHLPEEVKMGRFRNIGRQKRADVFNAARMFMRKTNWIGRYRFDIIQVVGQCWGNEEPEITVTRNANFVPSNFRPNYYYQT